MCEVPGEVDVDTCWSDIVCFDGDKVECFAWWCCHLELLGGFCGFESFGGSYCRNHFGFTMVALGDGDVCICTEGWIDFLVN